MTRLARTIHKLSAAAAGSSVRTARPTKRVPLDLLSASFHRYGAVCGELDGVEFAKRRQPMNNPG